jgi:hypothetical protein
VSPATKARRTARLLPVALFTRAAHAYGITESERTLILTGRLTRVQVGRRSFYLWSDVVAAMPAWARDLRHMTDAELRRGWRR